jgi:DHH family
MSSRVLNPILVEYCQRYQPENLIKPDLSEFFTNLDVQTHFQKMPYLAGIENFCLRLIQAYQLKEKICIYSDYDTDAVTATATMYHGLLDLGFEAENIEFYAPDRFTEGYGMNTEAAQMLSQKFDLIVSVDCGINSTQEATIIKKTNCDLIITDHHHLHGSVPDCVSVVNCRLAQVYCEDSELRKVFESDRQIFRQPIMTKLEDNLTKEQFDMLQLWLNSTEKSCTGFSTTPQKYLTQSATGVAVAWFSLVWLAYCMEFVNI